MKPSAIACARGPRGRGRGGGRRARHTARGPRARFRPVLPRDPHRPCRRRHRPRPRHLPRPRAGDGRAHRGGEPGCAGRSRDARHGTVPGVSGPGAPRVLVVDDEPQIHRFLGPALQAAGYEALRAGTATDGLRLAAQRSPALVLLDLGLPDMDGKLAIPRLRAFTTAPILVLSARDLETEKVAALDAGADDYVEKPFALAELLARVRAALRRADAARGPGTSAPTVRIGPLEIDLACRLARVGGGEPLKLTPREW